MDQLLLIDTSVLVELDRTKAGVYIDVVQHASKHKVILCTSTIVMFEFWTGTSLKNQQKVTAAERLFQPLRIYQLTDEMAKLAGELQRLNFVHNADALIAATAIQTGAQLVTLNTKHFENVPGLQLWRPQK